MGGLSHVGLVLLAGCTIRCGGGNLNMDNARKFVSETIKTYTGLEPTKVTCPDQVEAKKGADVICTFEVGGHAGTIKMKQTDEEGSVTVSEVIGIIASSKIETAIEDKLEEQAPSAEVDCGPRVHAVKPGDVLTCDVKDAQNVVARATVTIKDTANNIAFKVVPIGSEAAPGEEQAK
jgi:hypothetical protein